jgi:hypothetical protein
MTGGGKVFAMMVLAMALGVGMTGCTTSIWRDSSQMCVAHGGTYSAEGQKCSFATATTVSAQQACQDQAGVYFWDWQRCKFSE